MGEEVLEITMVVCGSDDEDGIKKRKMNVDSDEENEVKR